MRSFTICQANEPASSKKNSSIEMEEFFLTLKTTNMKNLLLYLY